MTVVLEVTRPEEFVLELPPLTLKRVQLVDTGLLLTLARKENTKMVSLALAPSLATPKPAIPVSIPLLEIMIVVLDLRKQELPVMELE